MLLDADNNEIRSVDMTSEGGTVSLTADPAQPCSVAVWLNNGEKVTLCKLDFEI